MKAEKLYDVVIYNIETGIIDSIAGRDMRRVDGFYNAESRLETVMPRLNNSYNASVVPAGKYAVGDKIATRHR